jgi:4-hydroxybenzoate polyprenyltransferase
MPQAVLGIAFSFGIPMAFCAVQGSVPTLAWILLFGNLFWVLAYDTEYAMVDRDDDLKIGMKTSAITMGRYDVAIIAFCYIFYLFIWSVAVDFIAYKAIYLAALLAAIIQVIWHISLIKNREREACFKAFRLNHWLGFTVFAGIALSLTFK